MAESQKSFGGGLVGLFMGEKADDKLKQVLSWPRAQGAYNSIIKGIGSQQWMDAWKKYTGQQEAYQPTRQANVPVYGQKLEDVWNTRAPGIEDFSAAISAAFAPIKEHSRDILDYGTAKIKGLLAARGEGNQGLSSSQQILNSTNAAINMANAFQPAYASVAPYFANLAAGRQADVDRKLGLLASDYLNAPADAAAQATFNPFLAQRQLQGVDLDLLGRAAEQQRANIAGWKTVPGLSTRLDDSAQGFMNLANFGMGMAGGIAGMGGGAKTPTTTPSSGGFSAPTTNFLQNDYLGQAQQYAPAMQSLYPTSTASSFGAPTNALNYNMNAYGLSPAYQEYRANPLF